ncbi:metal ABC transporter permease [Acidiferrimicrobium sp. IK]|uniref:metal ABC transporter permease n=1 Tax=Acidiferrimicrobium sp. IK TaxID=2871700 RepID=UPI0021CB7727|nr:metal ABC transporter permease [Acidiferrimicrobium sp. IK]MCU4182832.1 metal ABC transporter permease [Acidiferrimicrobium sp. IK]
MALLAVAAPRLGWNPVSDIDQLLRYHFMLNALRAGTIVAVAAGAIGWFMILRRQSFVGHTLATVGFPGASGAVWLGLPATWGYFGFCLAAAMVVGLLPRRALGAASSGLSEESAVIGTVQAMALGAGFLFTSLYHGFLSGTTGLLFGSFLGVTDAQVWTLLAVGLAALAVLVVIGRPLLFASVDPDVARARGVPVGALSFLFVLLLGAAAAEVSQITGTLLIFALLVMPAAAAQQLTTRTGRSLALTVLIAVAATWLGLAAAYFSAYPVGFYITTFGFAAYLLAASTRLVGGRPRRAGR